eukprot:UN26288
MAPEILRHHRDTMSIDTSKDIKVNYDLSADVFSLGIVIWQIFTQKEPYSHYKFKDTKAYYKAVLAGTRPNLDSGRIIDDVKPILKSCWHGKPPDRDKAAQIHHEIVR